MILNLTQYDSSIDQIKQGVQQKANIDIKQLLTFNTIPSKEELVDRANKIANIACKQLGEDSIGGKAMIKDPAFLMPYLERSLEEKLIQPIYSFDQLLDDGTFVHKGFVEA